MRWIRGDFAAIVFACVGSLGACRTGHAPAPADSQAPTAVDPLRARVKALDEALEHARKRSGIPGMAIAVVLDDRVVLAKGYGFADGDRRRPVDEHTIFALGSGTKAITATAIGVLVDEGRLGWDDTASRYLPGFAPALDAAPGTEPTLRDMLCHRTGFMRLVHPRASLDESLRMLSRARARAPFRSQFLYQNEMFAAAGVAAANAAGGDWESLVRSRVLAPLGMTDTYTSQSASFGDPRRAIEHDFVGPGRVAIPIDTREDRAALAPAGAIDTSARDLGELVRMYLDHGTKAGRRIVSERALTDMWTAQIRIDADQEYGLGWYLWRWRGRKVVDHGGNTAGFSAMIALLPEARVGFALLANVPYTTLQRDAAPLVFGTLLGEPTDDRAPAIVDRSASPTSDSPVAATPDPSWPARAAILELRHDRARARARTNLGVMNLRGTVRHVHQGLQGTAEARLSGDGRLELTQEIAGVGRQTIVLRDGRGLVNGRPSDPATVAMMRWNDPVALVGDWTRFGHVRIVNAGTDPVRWYLIELGEARPEVRVKVDATRWDLLEIHEPSPELDGWSIGRFESVRDVGGLRLPMRWILASGDSGDIVVEYTEVHRLARAPTEWFSMPGEGD